MPSIGSYRTRNVSYSKETNDRFLVAQREYGNRATGIAMSVLLSIAKTLRAYTWFHFFQTQETSGTKSRRFRRSLPRRQVFESYYGLRVRNITGTDAPG